MSVDYRQQQQSLLDLTIFTVIYMWEHEPFRVTSLEGGPTDEAPVASADGDLLSITPVPVELMKATAMAFFQDPQAVVDPAIIGLLKTGGIEIRECSPWSVRTRLQFSMAHVGNVELICKPFDLDFAGVEVIAILPGGTEHVIGRPSWDQDALDMNFRPYGLVLTTAGLARFRESWNFTPTVDHVPVLRVLSKSPTTMERDRILEELKSNMSEDKLRGIVNDLRKHGLTSPPRGERKGEAITFLGRLFLARIDRPNQKASLA